MFRAMIFDLDGTLLNTLPDLMESLNEALSLEGLAPRTEDEVRYFVGDGLEKLVIRAMPEGLRQPPHVKALLKRFTDIYQERQCLKTRPYEGVVELLGALRQRRMPLAVLSNKAHENTLAVVENFFPATFEVVFGLRPGAPPKPDPSSALEIAGKLGFGVGSILYAGDTAVDMKTALGAGMVPVGVTWGFRPEEELTAAGARRIAHKPEDILSVLDGEPAQCLT